MALKRCTRCGQDKLESAFNKSRYGLTARCKECLQFLDRERYNNNHLGRKDQTINRQRTRYKENGEEMRSLQNQKTYEFKLKMIWAIHDGKCGECGFEHPAALQFHHRDPSQKLFQLQAIPRTRSHPWSEILAEIAKCDLLCANCHLIRHSKYNDYVEMTVIPR